MLVVRVKEGALDGKANEAMLKALASAVGVGRGELRILAGHTSRTKVVEITGADPAAIAKLLGR